MASLSDSFNGDFEASKLNGAVLYVSNGAYDYYYDFTQRILTAGRGGVVPFAQLDRDVLIMMRDKLVSLGGDPPELAPEAPATQAPVRKFNL